MEKDKLECVGVEVMNDFFTKYHLSNGQVVHKFSRADAGDPHDHPWSFTSEILYGGYKEKVYHPSGYKITYRQLHEGNLNRVEATTIHLITELLREECWTLVTPEPATQKSGFYQFRLDGVYHRYWDEEAFTQVFKHK